MSNVGEPVVQTRCGRCGWQGRRGDAICESCRALIAGPRGLGVAAGRGRRVAAALIDALMVGVPAVVGWLIWAGDFADDGSLTNRQQIGLIVANLISFSVWAAAVAALAGRRQSPGKVLLRMRVVRIDGGETTTGQFLARQAGWWLLLSAGSWIAQIPNDGTQAYEGLALMAVLLLIVDTGMLLLSRSRQSVHDKIFRTIVVEAAPAAAGIAAQATAEPAAEAELPEPAATPEPSVPPAAEPSEPAAVPEPAATGAEPGPGEAKTPSGAGRSAAAGDVQQELEELERVREYLTPAQYERRRRSILGEDADGER